MEVLGVVASVLGGMVVLVGVGYLIGLAASSPGSATIQTGAPPTEACAKACADWRMARMAVCGARAELASAISFRDSAYMLWLGVLGSALAMTAAASAAQFIPIVGVAIAAALFSAAATLLATAAILGGVYAGAAAAVLTKQNELNKRDVEEQLARLKVRETCSQAAADACLNSPPC